MLRYFLSVTGLFLSLRLPCFVVSHRLLSINSIGTTVFTAGIIQNLVLNQVINRQERMVIIARILFLKIFSTFPSSSQYLWQGTERYVRVKDFHQVIYAPNQNYRRSKYQSDGQNTRGIRFYPDYRACRMNGEWG